jgi:DNA invertase Pin-like site-specific DNA recombinase
MRAAFYARVSSAGQRERHTIESQLRDGPTYIAAQGWSIVNPDRYIDDGKSAKAGQLEKRDGFARLLADAKAGLFDVVVVVAIDRLTRSEDPVERAMVVASIKAAGAQLAVVGAGIQDTSTFAGDAYVTLQALFAAEENRRRRERTIAGQRTAVARGRKPSGPTPYGLRYDRITGAWSIDEPEATIVREIFDRVIARHGTVAIAADLTHRGVRRARSDRWTRARVHLIATSTVYRGEWYARAEHPIPVPAIVDLETYEAAQHVLMVNASQRGKKYTRHVYLLADLAVCGGCGGRIGVASPVRRWTGRNGKTRGDVAARYICCRRRRPLPGHEPCPAPSQLVEDADRRLWSAVRGLVEGPAARMAREEAVQGAMAADPWANDLAAATKRMERISATEGAILSRFRAGRISEAAMDVELDALNRDLAMTKRQIETASRAQRAARKQVHVALAAPEILAQLRAVVERADDAARREVIESLFLPGDLTLRPDGSVHGVGSVRETHSSRRSEHSAVLTFRVVA